MRKQHGMALVYSLVFSVLLIGTGMAISSKLKLFSEEAFAIQDYVRVEMQIKDVAARVIFSINTNTPLLFNTQEYELDISGKPIKLNEHLTVEIRDAAGMVSLTPLDALTLNNIIAAQIPSVLERQRFINSLLDWIDSDNIPRLYGQEQVSLIQEGSIAPRNGFMQTVNELKYINGMNVELFEKLKHIFVPVSDASLDTAKISPEINLLTGSSNSLWVSPYSSVVEGVLFQSGIADIKISYVGPKVSRKLYILLDIDESKDYPYAIIHWES
jgi:type II secretory pathway component PulK